MFQPDGYRKFLLNRATATLPITEYIESCISSSDAAAEHAFHKIMVLHFSDRDSNLFDIISEYFGGFLVPVHFQTQNIMTTFYTNNLKLILKIIKLDFIFPYNRNMYNIDILFNDKTSTECFGSIITLDEIISGVVSKRINEKFELDLSDFCNDPEFKEYKIYFYKLSLLSYYKTLMLRMGRDTTMLNLSNNNLSQVPQDILNFFIKGGLTAIDFSNNLIPSISELQRVSSRIERLWLEGNPLCEELDAPSYIKQLILKFPRLTELDGIALNHHGAMLPFYKNFLVTPDRRTKVIVEKFVTLYFTHFDGEPSSRKKLQMFYDNDARLSISTCPSDGDKNWSTVYQQISRNLLKPNPKSPGEIRGRKSILRALCTIPATIHDLTSFSVDILLHNKKHLLMVIDGVLQEITKGSINKRYLSFRRTFLLTIHPPNVKYSTSTYLISKEMYSLTSATPNQIENFQLPLRNLDTIALFDPDKDDISTLTTIFMHITQLKNMELCEQRLKAANWDLKLALQLFHKDVQNNTINPAKFNENDDCSDTSSLLQDEID